MNLNCKQKRTTLIVFSVFTINYLQRGMQSAEKDSWGISYALDIKDYAIHIRRFNLLLSK